MTSQGLFGAGQGSQGSAQGYQGAQEGLSNGSNTGMQRAASGGMTPNAQPGQSGEQRKPQGLFSLLGTIASALPIPGASLIGGALSGIAGIQAQNQAKAAAAAAQGAQGNALLGASNIAGNLAGPPDYSGIIKAETSGINTLRNNLGGIANPGAVLNDMQGRNIESAISGANQNLDARLGAAAGIEQGNATQYGGIGQRAGEAAAAQGNPFSLFSNALKDAGGVSGISGFFSRLFGSGGSTNDAGGINVPGSATVNVPDSPNNPVLSGGIDSPNFGSSLVQGAQQQAAGTSQWATGANAPQIFGGFK